jgi:hypothetical protein
MRTTQTMPVVTANKGYSELSMAFVEYLFNSSGPKFLFDDIYHFSMRHYARHRNNRNMLPVVKLMTATVLERMGALNAPILFVPEAITNGKPYLELAEKHESRIRQARDGRLTTYRMGEILNKDELDNLTEKNKNRAMTRLEGFRRLYPYYSVMSPTGMEAMLKTLVKDAGFTNYQMLRDEDFEAFWIAVCLNSLRGGFADDVAYSRNGNFETFALFQVQYGLIPFRPHGDIDVVMPGKRVATPYDYTEMLFAHLLDVVPRGFTSDLSVKMAMRMIMLEDMRTNGMPHPVWGELKPERMNPKLRGLSAAHDRDFAKLRRDILLFMRDHNLDDNLGDMYGLDGYDCLREYYNDQISTLSLSVSPGGGGGGRYEAQSQAKLDMDSKLKKKSLFNILSVSIPYQLDGDFFSSNPKLMPDHEFTRLGIAEQVALKAFMGLSETVKPSQKSGQSVLLLTDRRGGEIAGAHAVKLGMAIPAEVRGLKGSFSKNNFEAEVKAKNIHKSQKVIAELYRAHPDASISSSEQVEHDADVFRYYRQAISAPGADRLSGQAKIIYLEEMLRRQSTLAVFDRGWENSGMLTAIRSFARKIQLGLVARPINLPATHLNIADLSIQGAERNHPYVLASLGDDLDRLTSYMKRLYVLGTEDYPRQLVRGLLETVVFTDLYYNRNLNLAAGEGRPLIDWQAVPMSVKEGLETHKNKILDLREEAKNLILKAGIVALSPDELTGQLELIDPDYLRAHGESSALQKNAGRRSSRDGSQRKLGGFNAS